MSEATLVVNALYAALGDPQHCHLLLRGAQKVPGDHPPASQTMHDAVKAFDRDDGLQLTAQLTAIACLAQLCAMEARHGRRSQRIETGDPRSSAWYDRAQANGTFELAMDVFMHTLQVCPALPCPALPCPALPCPAQPSPACHAMLHTALVDCIRHRLENMSVRAPSLHDS